MEAFDIDGNFRSLDFDNMRLLFKEAFTKLLQEIAECVNENDELVDIDTLRHKVSAQINGIHFRVISDTKNTRFNFLTDCPINRLLIVCFTFRYSAFSLLFNHSHLRNKNISYHFHV